MNSSDANVNCNLTVVVEGNKYLKTNFRMSFLFAFEKMVQHIQDSARTSSEIPHFLAESIMISIDKQDPFPFTHDLPFKELIYGSRKGGLAPTINLIVSQLHM